MTARTISQHEFNTTRLPRIVIPRAGIEIGPPHAVGKLLHQFLLLLLCTLLSSAFPFSTTTRSTATILFPSRPVERIEPPGIFVVQGIGIVNGVVNHLATVFRVLQTNFFKASVRGIATMVPVSARRYPLALCTEWKQSSDDRPPCLENPRPKGAESTLTENAATSFHAEPRHERRSTSRGRTANGTWLQLASHQVTTRGG
jgi:hypothetical protein